MNWFKGYISRKIFGGDDVELKSRFSLLNQQKKQAISNLSNHLETKVNECTNFEEYFRVLKNSPSNKEKEEAWNKIRIAIFSRLLSLLNMEAIVFAAMRANLCIFGRVVETFKLQNGSTNSELTHEQHSEISPYLTTQVAALLEKVLPKLVKLIERIVKDDESLMVTDKIDGEGFTALVVKYETQLMKQLFHNDDETVDIDIFNVTSTYSELLGLQSPLMNMTNTNMEDVWSTAAIDKSEKDGDEQSSSGEAFEVEECKRTEEDHISSTDNDLNSQNSQKINKSEIDDDDDDDETWSETCKGAFEEYSDIMESPTMRSQLRVSCESICALTIRHLVEVLFPTRIDNPNSEVPSFPLASLLPRIDKLGREFLIKRESLDNIQVSVDTAVFKQMDSDIFFSEELFKFRPSPLPLAHDY
eukprot:TRINITY_DN1390_c0_g1_i1.p1 TRINITY_DN1390_c0_g1~~TRINITY_DN1390_c0_g1_i1.p1  ORF type:complete len:416 (+),score=92.13 TRINITY_DN1390_c0_g1_i1:55-1302(+)